MTRFLKWFCSNGAFQNEYRLIEPEKLGVDSFDSLVEQLHCVQDESLC